MAAHYSGLTRHSFRVRLQLFVVVCLPLVLVVFGGCVSRLPARRVNPANSGNAANPSPEKPYGRGVYYSLPRTVVTVETPLIRVTKRKGEFGDLKEFFFPDLKTPEDECKKDTCRTFELGDVVFTLRGEPDPDEIFLVELNGGRWEDRKFTLTVSEDGVPDKIEVESFARGGEIITQLASTAAGLAARGFAAGATTASAVFFPPPVQGGTPKCPSERLSEAERAFCQQLLTDDDRKFFADLPPEEREDYRKMSSFLREKFRSKGTDLEARAHFLRAFKVFQRIESQQAERGRVVGTASLQPNLSPELFRQVVAELDASIQNSMGRFVGTKETKEVWLAKYALTPLKSFTSDANETLFEFDPNAGLCSHKETGGIQLEYRLLVPPNLGKTTCTERRAFSIKVEREPGGATEVAGNIAKGRTEPQNGNGLFYRIPGRGRVTALECATPLAYARPTIAQFGTVVSLPESTGGRKTQYKLELYPATGAMRTFTVNTEAALEKERIAELGKAAGEVLDAREAKKKAEAAKQDELAKAKYERELLEEKVKIKEAKEKLEESSGTP